MKRHLLLLFTLLSTLLAFGQSLPIRITITIAPPFPTSLTYYGDHPEQVIINVTNTTRLEQSFRLVGSITGTDNNVKILTKDRGASDIITLNPNESRLLTVPEIQNLFDSQKFTYTGITYNRAQIDDGLPEGTYEVCGYAVDPFQTNVLKGEQTCSNPIFVTNLEPPIIINPLPDAQVMEMPVQNIVFTWTLPASAPPQTDYTFRMVEIMGNLNPNNAIQAATTPIFFEKTVQFNTLLYGPADPPLTVGKKYAYMVTARDPLGKAVFRNGGRSAVQTFMYGIPERASFDVSSFLKLNLPSDKAKIAPSYQNGKSSYEFTWTGPEKTLYNQRYSIRIAKLKENQSPADGLAKDTVFYTRTVAAKPGKFVFRPEDVFGFPAGKYAWQVTLITQSVSSSNQGAKPVLSNIYTFESASKQIKIAGTIKYRMASNYGEPTYGFDKKEVKVILSYAATVSDVIASGMTPDPAMVVDGLCDLSGTMDPSGPNATFPNAGKVLAKVTTNQFGAFTATVFEDLGETVEITANGWPPVKVYKILKVVPSDLDNRYTSAEGFFVAKKNPTPENPQNIDVANKNFVVRALTFQLNVKLTNLPKKDYLGKGLAAENTIDTKTDVYVLRKKKIVNANFPEHEGDNASNNQTLKVNGQSYDIISKKSASLGQTVNFQNLVRNKVGIPDDRFYIYAKLKNSQGEIVDPQEFKSYFKWKSTFFSVDENGIEIDQKFETKEYDKHDYINNDNTNEVSLKADKLTNTVISGVLKTHWACDLKENSKTDLPLGNTTVTLRSHFVFQPAGKNYTVEVANYNYGSNVTFGTTTTDKNGNFNFNVNIGFTGTDYENSSKATLTDAYLDNGLGWVQKNYKFTGPTPTGYQTGITGTLYKVLKLEVDNPYVTSPDDPILVTPGYTYNVGTLLANVREGDLTLTVKTFDEKTPDVYNKPLSAAKVYLCRNADNKNLALPSDEGNLNTVVKKNIQQNGITYKVLAEYKTDVNGVVYFSRLVKSSQFGDFYTLIVKDDETGDVNYTGTKLYLPAKSCPNMSIGSLNPNTSIFNSEEPCFAGKGCYKATMEADPLPPVIAGAVYPDSKFSFDPIAGAKVELFTISAHGYTFIQKEIIKKYNTPNDVADAFAAEGQFSMKFMGYIQKEDEQIVADNGKFRFENLKPETGTQTQPLRLIWVSKKGFLDQVMLVNLGKPMIMGQKANMGSVLLRLPVIVNAELVEEYNDKQGVKAKAIVGENYSWAGSSPSSNCSLETIKGPGGTNLSAYVCTEKIKLECPRGKVQVTFYPEDADNYLPLTTTIDVPAGKESFTLPYKLRFATKKHRITLLPKEKGTKTFPKIVRAELINASVANYKSNAHINVGYGGVYGKPGGPYYVAPIMEFRSAVNDFTFRVSADGYVAREIKIHNEPSDIHQDYEVELEPAGTVKGMVKGPNEEAVGNAKVYFEVSGGGTIETTTFSDGKYELSGVPLNKNIMLKATATNYIGDEKTFDSSPKPAGSSGQKVYINGQWVTINVDVATGSSVSTVFKVDLQLTKVEDLDLNKIAGLQVEVTKAVKSGTGYKVSGRFSELPENNVFSYAAGNSVSFHDVEVVSAKEKYGSDIGSSGKATACLKTTGLVDALGIPVKLYKEVHGSIVGGSFSGIDWEEEGSNKGVLKGSILGDLSAFPSGIEKSGVSSFGLVPKTAPAGQVLYNTFTADKSFANTGFKVKHAYKNEPFRFKLHQYYEAEADMASNFQDGILKLNTTIHTKLEHFADGGDINLKVGEVTVSPNAGVQNIIGKSELKLNLGKAVAGKSNWSIVSNNWSFGKGGLVLKTGTLNTGIGVTFKDMQVTDTKLLFGDYNTTGGLTLGNDIPLTLEPTASLAFGYDAGFGDGAWALSILPGPGKANCASFTGLPGISGAFQISNVKTFSTGDMQIGLNTFAPVQVYNKTAIFRPATINVSDGYVNMWGDLDYEIPNMPMKDAYSLTFVRENGQLVMKPLKRSFKMEINGVVANFPESAQQSLDNTGLTLYGTLEDKIPGTYNFKVILTKKSTGEIDLTTYGDNKFYTDKNSTDKGLEQVKGSMVVESDKRWGYFAFNGLMFGYDGVKPDDRTMYMIVKGDLEADPKTHIGVTNMGNSMLNMSIVYDFKKSALIGTLHTKQDISSCTVTMDLELFFGKNNWYLFGTGDADLPAGFPIAKVKVAFLVGRFMVPQLSSTITTTFSEFTWNKKLPLALAPSGEGNSDPSKGAASKNTYKAEYIGILFAGGFSIPIPYVPEVNFNVKPIAQAKLTHEIHANLVLGLNFNDKSIAIDANVGAKLNLSVGASIGLICAGLDLNVAADVYAAGTLNTDLSLLVLGGASVTLSGTMMVGGGWCDSDCDGYFCVTDSFSKSKTIGVTISYQSGHAPDYDFN